MPGAMTPPRQVTEEDYKQIIEEESLTRSQSLLHGRRDTISELEQEGTRKSAKVFTPHSVQMHIDELDEKLAEYTVKSNKMHSEYQGLSTEQKAEADGMPEVINRMINNRALLQDLLESMIKNTGASQVQVPQ